MKQANKSKWIALAIVAGALGVMLSAGHVSAEQGNWGAFKKKHLVASCSTPSGLSTATSTPSNNNRLTASVSGGSSPAANIWITCTNNGLGVSSSLLTTGQYIECTNGAVLMNYGSTEALSACHRCKVGNLN
jgi:hypothetical protein